MRVTSHGQYLTQLTRFPAIFPINSYIVADDDGLTVVDTGMAGSGPAILKAAHASGLPVVRIVLTHAHADHAGSLNALHRLVPAAEIMLSARDARLLAGDRQPSDGEPPARLRGTYTRSALSPTRLLQAGERVGSLQVVAAPGHTPGHLAFLDTRTRVLIAGDAFQTRGGLAVAGTVRPFFPFPAMATWHRPTAVASARALCDLAPTALAVGHGPMLFDPVEAMQRAVAGAERSVETLVEYGS